MADRWSNPTLYVMVKVPVAGGVKTRLAAGIGSIEAARFYRNVTASVLRRVASDGRWTTVLAVSPDCAVNESFWPASLPRVGQGRGDLGARMQRLLDLGPGPNILIGSDIPEIQTHHVAAAFAILKHKKVVFGPAEDGGFWLVGSHGQFGAPRLFRKVRWSTEHALADSLTGLGSHAGLAPMLADVDGEPDWQRWRRRHGRSRSGMRF